MIRTGLLAFGMSGKVFQAPFIQHHPQFDLVAVCERNEATATHFYPQIKSYTDVESLLNDPEIDLIIVNTPNHTHYEYALKALEAGKHILVEKPFCTSLTECTHIFELAEKKNLHVFVYQNRRYDRDFLSVKFIVEAGKLGKLNEVHFRFDRYKASIGPKAFKETAIAGAGILFDLGPHLIDQAMALFGIPLSYQVFKSKNRKLTQVDDYAFVLLIYENGLHVHITLSMLTLAPEKAYVLHGCNGTFVKERTDQQEQQLINGMSPLDPHFANEIPHKEGILTVNHEELTGKISFPLAAPKGNYMAFFDAVYESIVFNKPFIVTKEQILKQIEIITAI